MSIHDTIKDSGLFTQVEPQWLADSDGETTYINRTRGVVLQAKTDSSLPRQTVRVFYDTGGETYASSGYYDAEELTKWWFPVMRSDRAWTRYIDQADHSRDITEVLDLV